jgi:glycerol-3-phosphate O-acyltransferase
MEAVGKVVPALPVPLVATAFLRDPGGRRSELELKADVQRLIGELERAGAHVYIPRADQDYAVTVGLRMLTLRRMVREEDGLYAVEPAEIPLLAYYANSIRHLIPAAPVAG